MDAPRFHAWLVPGRLAVAERPGGGGRSHRRDRRERELAWWKAAGATSIVSGMRSRHGLLEAALEGFNVRWHPLAEPDQAAREAPVLVATAIDLMEAGPGAVMVHVDRPGEWLAGVDGALRLGLGVARTRADALEQAAGDGLPVGEIARAVIAGMAIRRVAGGRRKDSVGAT